MNYSAGRPGVASDAPSSSSDQEPVLVAPPRFRCQVRLAPSTPHFWKCENSPHHPHTPIEVGCGGLSHPHFRTSPAPHFPEGAGLMNLPTSRPPQLDAPCPSRL